jgi:Ribosomal protein L18
LAKGPNYKVKYRRRREGKTNYYKRYRYVLSGATRLVIRRTNKYIFGQVVNFDPKGDKVRVSAHSIELMKKYGWKGGTKNLSASYLTGFLLGLRAKGVGVEKVTVDLGLFKPQKGGRVFAFLKGFMDAGVDVPAGEIEMNENRIKGLHISKYAEQLEQDSPESVQRRFKVYFERGLNPKDLPKHFEEVLNRIKEGGGK